MEFNNETNESLASVVLLPEGVYGVAITPRKGRDGEEISPIMFLKDNNNYNSYYVLLQMIILGNENFDEINDSVEIYGDEARICGWEEQVFITLVSKNGDQNKFGMENFSKLLSYAGCVSDSFSISKPEILEKTMSELYPVNEDGSFCIFVKVKVTHWKNKEGKKNLNVNFCGPCEDKEKALVLFRNFGGNSAVPF